MEPTFDGQTFGKPSEYPTMRQLTNLRDYLLSENEQDAAAATDNLIDILRRIANPEDLGTHVIISGGEALELGSYGSEEIPF